jgi:hypothetical protein
VVEELGVAWTPPGLVRTPALPVSVLTALLGLRLIVGRRSRSGA